MPTQEMKTWYHSNKYSAGRECEHCSGVVRHEPWCITRNADVAYAYAVIVDPTHLTVQDQLILHALGATWTGKACQGNCRK
jgi:hypothetical protein